MTWKEILAPIKNSEYFATLRKKLMKNIPETFVFLLKNRYSEH